MANVRLDGLYKRYEDVVAVNDMNLEIEDGEFICLVGPSGCGKSTTLEMVAGLTSPSEGTVHISDTDVTEFPPKDRNIAMVFQNIALFPHMDVYDNVSYGLRLRSVPKDDIDDRVGRAMEILQLEGMLDRTIARPMATRWRWPPDSSAGIRSSIPSSWRISIARPTRSSISSFGTLRSRSP